VSGRAAVTGASGFIGWHVCERLRDTGWTVVGVVRPGSARPLPAGVERATAPLESGALGRACAGASAIVHAAGLTRSASETEYRRVNVEGTRAVAEAAQALDARLIHISSLAAAGPAPADRPRTESSASAPITPYGHSKLESEAVVAATSGLRWTTVRPAVVYGPRDRQFLPLFRAARRGRVPCVPNAAAYWITMAYVGDVARAVQLMCVADSVDGDTFFVGHPSSVSLATLMQTVATTLRRPYRTFAVPAALLRAAAWLRLGGMNEERLAELMSPGFVCSVDKAERRLGFRAAVDLEEGLQATAAWYVANRWMK
jgi:nucleoside-diphosphate-sugar epimerase